MGASTGSKPPTNSKAGTPWTQDSSKRSSRRSTATSWDREPMRPRWVLRLPNRCLPIRDAEPASGERLALRASEAMAGGDDLCFFTRFADGPTTINTLLRLAQVSLGLLGTLRANLP